MYTIGLELLIAQIRSGTQADAARLIDHEARQLGRDGPKFSAMQLNHIIHGRRLPTLGIACAIDAAYGIPPRAWLQPTQAAR